MTVAVELVDVHKRYPGGAAALDGLSLSVEDGRVLVLLGTSGSGKTTALKTLNRLVEPDAGSVVVLGRRLESWDPIELRRRTGYVIQEAGLIPHFTVERNVGLVPELMGWPPARRAARSHELLALVGLNPGRFASLPPFGALDPLTRRRLQDEFRALQSRLGKTVLLVTHDVPEAFRLGDEVAVMDRGRVLQRGTPAQLRESPHPGFVADFIAAALP